MMYQNSKLIFLGDSLTQFHDWSNFGAHHNAGIAGDTTAGLLYRLHYTLEKAPQTLVLQIGINDLLQGQYIETIQENYLKIMTKIQNIPKIVLISLLPVEMYDGSHEINEKIILLNHFLKHTCKQYGFIYVDLYTQMVGSDGGIQKAFTSDGVHLTDKAYKVWESVLKDHL